MSGPPGTPPPAARAGAAGRREAGAVALACAAGGGLALLGASQPWLRLSAARRAPLPAVAVDLTGRDLAPLVAGLGLLGLAGVVGLLATRRWGRLAVGAVLAAAGLAIVVSALPRVAVPGASTVRELLSESGRGGGVPADAAVDAVAVPAWPLVAALGGLLLAAGGVAVLLRSRRWPTMSARYEQPAARPAAAVPTDAALWDALDSGHDPTATPDPPPAPAAAPTDGRPPAAGPAAAGPEVAGGGRGAGEGPAVERSG